jgi:hypothetical protein
LDVAGAPAKVRFFFTMKYRVMTDLTDFQQAANHVIRGRRIPVLSTLVLAQGAGGTLVFHNGPACGVH